MKRRRFAKWIRTPEGMAAWIREAARIHSQRITASSGVCAPLDDPMNVAKLGPNPWRMPVRF